MLPQLPRYLTSLVKIRGNRCVTGWLNCLVWINVSWGHINPTLLPALAFVHPASHPGVSHPLQRPWNQRVVGPVLHEWVRPHEPYRYPPPPPSLRHSTNFPLGINKVHIYLSIYLSSPSLFHSSLQTWCSSWGTCRWRRRTPRQTAWATFFWSVLFEAPFESLRVRLMDLK